MSDSAEEAARTGEASLATHKGLFGRLRGFSVLGMKAAARRRAEASQARVHSAQNHMDFVQDRVERLHRDYRLLNAEGTELVRQQAAAQKQMARWGTAEEMDAAELLLTTTIDHSIGRFTDEAQLRIAHQEHQVTNDEFTRAMRVLQARQTERQTAKGGVSR